MEDASVLLNMLGIRISMRQVLIVVCVAADFTTVSINTLIANAQHDVAPKLRLQDRGALFRVVNSPGSVCEAARISPTALKLSQIKDGTSKTLLIGEYVTSSQLLRATYWGYTFYGMNLGTITLPINCYKDPNCTNANDMSAQFDPDFDKCTANTTVQYTCYHAFSGIHAGGTMNFCYCDGSVRTISSDVDLKAFAAAATAGGDENESL